MSFESQESDVYPGDEDKKKDSGKKKDGKKDKKEKGYQMFEEEDSEEERLVLSEEIKSPTKTKKEKLKPSFKFPVPVRKEKTKEKEEKKESKEDKEKKKEEKKKNKLKEKKKFKSGHHETIVVEANVNENPIFGVPLATAVERNKSHDGIELPAIVRECIDYIEECGLACEGIYRISGVKSKVQHLKDCYNRQQQVHLFEHEPNIVASLLKQFLRDLPEPVLTTALMPKFEEASTIKNNKKKVEAFIKLISDLPTCNRLLLSWMIVHMTHVIELAKENKMTLQNVSIVLSPTMQISHRVLNVLFSNVSDIFGDVLLRKYIPPLKPAHSKWSLELPDNPSALEEELAKQESLLTQLHAEVNSGREDPQTVEQLWEVQRVVTQLKRKIKTAKKNVEMAERRRSNLEAKRSSTASIPSLSAPEDLQLSLRLPPEPASNIKADNQAPADITPTKSKQQKEEDQPKPLPKVEHVTVTVDVERHPDSERPSHLNDHPEPKKGVKFAESTKKTRAPQISEIKRMEGEKQVQKVVEEPVKKEEKEHPEKEVAKPVQNVDEGVKETIAETIQDISKSTVEEAEEIKESGDSHVEAENSNLVDGKTEKETKAIPVELTTVPIEEKSIDDTQVTTIPETEESVGVKEDVSIVVKKDIDSRVAEKIEPELPKELTQKTVDLSEEIKADNQAPADITPTKSKQQNEADQPKPPPKVEHVYRKPPNPPFMSTALLQPMKAEIPKPKPPSDASEDKKEHLRKSEELRELEEELLGEKKQAESSDEEYDLPEDVDIEQLLDEEYALKLEEEELLAIADELRQKIATERSEMERLTQEIQELQYLRQDSDLEDLSSSSSSSEESEDEEDMQELLTQLIQDNEDLEMQNADLCQKIHEERMICLSVKLQIRLLQQKHLETSYG